MCSKQRQHVLVRAAPSMSGSQPLSMHMLSCSVGSEQLLCLRALVKWWRKCVKHFPLRALHGPSRAPESCQDSAMRVWRDLLSSRNDRAVVGLLPTWFSTATLQCTLGNHRLLKKHQQNKSPRKRCTHRTTGSCPG